MSILDELLQLKQFRENKAERSVAVCRLMLAEVVGRTERAKQALSKYIGWSRQREADLYAALYGRRVLVRDIERTRDDVLAMRHKERGLRESVTRTEQEREHSEQALRHAREAHESATRIREKFLQLVGLQSEEIRLENERKEDAEMDDLHAVRRDRQEWETHDDD